MTNKPRRLIRTAEVETGCQEVGLPRAIRAKSPPGPDRLHEAASGPWGSPAASGGSEGRLDSVRDELQEFRPRSEAPSSRRKGQAE